MSEYLVCDPKCCLFRNSSVRTFCSQTTSLYLNLEDVTRKDSGRYICSAVNRRGYSEGWIDVTGTANFHILYLPLTFFSLYHSVVRPRLINVTIPIPNYVLVENDTDIVIYCEITQKDADITWSFSNGHLNDLKYEVNKKKMELKG